MEYIALAIFGVLTVVYFMLWLRIRRDRNGFREELTTLTSGRLTNQVVQRKGKSGALGDEGNKKTQVTYTYEVNGVTYHCACTLVNHFRPVPASTKVVYQLKHPDMAYLPEFEKPDVKGMGAFYLSGAILFFSMALVYIIFGM